MTAAETFKERVQEAVTRLQDAAIDAAYSGCHQGQCSAGVLCKKHAFVQSAIRFSVDALPELDHTGLPAEYDD